MLLPCHMGSVKGFVSYITRLNRDSSKLLFICVAVAFGSDVQSTAEKAVGSHLLPPQRHPCFSGHRDEVSRRDLSLWAEG